MVGAFCLALAVANSTFAQNAAQLPAFTPSIADDPVSPPDDLPPHGDKLRMVDVCELAVEDGQLSLRTRMPTNRQVQSLSVPIEGLRGANTIRVERDGPALEPALFYLVNNDTEQPEASLVQTQVSLTSGQLLVHQHVQTRDGWKVVSLSQGGDTESASPAPATVTLTVTRGTAPDRRIQCSAPDWVTFRRLFPREVNAHLRPLFRAIRQEQVFAIEPVVAWQVFREEWTEDSQVGLRIADLLPALDAEDFATRNRAWAKLQQQGIAGALFLNDFDTSKLSPEQASRIDAFLSAFPLLTDQEVLANRADPNFLLDCLYGSDEHVRSIALGRLSAALRHTIDWKQAVDDEQHHALVNAWRTEARSVGTAQAASQ